MLLAPRLFASVSYFKTKHACHDVTLYHLATKTAACYLWHKGQGDITSNNFASCIRDYLVTVANNSPSPLKMIILHSDGCCSQNRNILVSNCLLQFSIQTGITVMQKHLETGHVWMEVDGVHAAIKRKLRDRQILSPVEYIQVKISARQHLKLYAVKDR